MSLLRHLSLAVFLIVSYGPFFTLNAQIVNIENQRLSFSDTVRWRGNVQSSLFYKEYSSIFFSSDTKGYVSYRHNRQTWMFSGDYGVTRASGHDYENQYFVHIRYNRSFNKWLVGEAFSQIQQNKILNVRNRYLAGLGPRAEFRIGDEASLFLGCLYMYEYELPTDFAAAAWVKNRNSSYLSFAVRLNPLVTLMATNYYQPNLGDFNDYRLMGQYRLLVLMTRRLNLKIETNMIYDSRPVPGAVNSYSDLTFGALFDF